MKLALMIGGILCGVLVLFFLCACRLAAKDDERGGTR